MGDFNVDTDELLAVGRLLDAVRAELSRLHGQIDDLRAHTLGCDPVSDALNAFADHWRFGLGRMRDRAGFVAEALAAAGRTYQTVDAQLAAGIHRAAGGSG
ncbi:MAG: WXG100 family type VII secretion target [Actinomycetes bacterium]|jgi:hypothetical protein|nr:hypothetical protein [Actinomycetes bacterium]